MDAQALQNVCRQVAQRFPVMKGKSPSVSPYAGGQFLLVFTATATAADGRAIQQTIRVVAAADGKVVKMTASR